MCVCGEQYFLHLADSFRTFLTIYVTREWYTACLIKDRPHDQDTLQGVDFVPRYTFDHVFSTRDEPYKCMEPWYYELIIDTGIVGLCFDGPWSARRFHDYIHRITTRSVSSSC